MSIKEKMIDIHCHILPDVDDGAVDMTESVEMLRIAAECGVTDIIATPHCAPGEFDNYAGEKLFAVFSELCEALSKTGAEIGLHLGTEVFACPETLKLTDSGKLLTLADSDFMLVECAFDEDPWFMLEMLQTVAASGKNRWWHILKDTILFRMICAMLWNGLKRDTVCK